MPSKINIRSSKITTTEFRVSFPHVFQTHKASDDAKPKYSISMLFPEGPDSISEIKRIVKEVLEQYKVAEPKVIKQIERKEFLFPWENGTAYNEREDGKYPEAVGMTVVKASAAESRKPGVVDQNLQAITDPSEFYAGCYARASIVAFAWENTGKRGISLGLNNVQKLRDGDPLGGGNSRPEDDFEKVKSAAGITGGSSDEDFDLG